jgi:hypothetical protein
VARPAGAAAHGGEGGVPPDHAEERQTVQARLAQDWHFLPQPVPVDENPAASREELVPEVADVLDAPARVELALLVREPDGSGCRSPTGLSLTGPFPYSLTAIPPRVKRSSGRK